MLDIQLLLDAVKLAVEAGKLSSNAFENLKNWIEQPKYAKVLPEIVKHIQEEQWQELDDAFWKVLEFGTGGRRGRMYPFGSNTINERTIGESAQGLANYINSQVPGESRSCAIAYDTRHLSREFAELCRGHGRQWISSLFPGWVPSHTAALIPSETKTV